MGASNSCDQRDSHITARAGRGEGERIGLSVCPICRGDVEGRAWGAVQDVGRREVLQTVLLRMDSVFRIGARDEDFTRHEKYSFGVVESIDGGVGHDSHSRADGFGGIVQNRIVVWITAETEAGFSTLTTIQNEVRAIW